MSDIKKQSSVFSFIHVTYRERWQNWHAVTVALMYWNVLVCFWCHTQKKNTQGWILCKELNFFAHSHGGWKFQDQGTDRFSVLWHAALGFQDDTVMLCLHMAEDNRARQTSWLHIAGRKEGLAALQWVFVTNSTQGGRAPLLISSPCCLSFSVNFGEMQAFKPLREPNDMKPAPTKSNPKTIEKWGSHVGKHVGLRVCRFLAQQKIQSE